MEGKAKPLSDLKTELSLPQLSAIKQQLDQEIELLAASIQQLQSAQSKYQDSGECVANQSKVANGTEIMVPLTSSMYINGTIASNDKFLIDIGTGYYVEKNRDAAANYFKRKVAFVSQEVEKCAKITQQKIAVRESIIEALLIKQKAMPASQQQSTIARTTSS